MSEGYKPLVQNESLGEPDADPTSREPQVSQPPAPPPPGLAAVSDADYDPSKQYPTQPRPPTQDFPPSYQPQLPHSTGPPVPGAYQPPLHSTGPPVLGAYQPAPQYGGQPGPSINTSNTVIVQQQPYAAVQVAPFSKPNNYLALSILNTIFCCFICGLIAVIFSTQVDDHYQAGRFEEARSASRTARNLNIASLVSYLVGGAVFGGFAVLGFFLQAV